MGESLGTLHYELSQELVTLHSEWESYVTLYGESENNVKILNKTAPWFFYLTQRMLFNQVLLHASRLIDPPEMGDNENLTLQRLPREIPEDKLRESVQSRIDDLLDAAEFARQQRHKRIAHLDLQVHRGEHPEPLEPATRERVERILEMMRKIMNEIDGYYRDSERAYEHLSTIGKADALLSYLERGLEAEADRRRQLRQRAEEE